MPKNIITKKATADEIFGQIKRLQNELFETDVQFELYAGLRKSAPDYVDEFKLSRLFWDYTLTAHINMVVLRLCRIYDTHDQAFSLPIFLKTVESNSHLFDKEAYLERNKDNPNLEWLAQYPRGINLEDLKENSTIV